jgi:predicted RNase H-like HicB family nuclease
MFLYIAINKDENTGYGVTVPSLPGCFSYGDTLNQAIDEAKQAILFHIEGILEDGKEPETQQPTLDTLITNPDYAGAQWFGIEVNIEHLTLKPERFNVSWPKYLLDKVDNYVLLTHDTRSNFLAKAALDRIDRTSQNAS